MMKATSSGILSADAAVVTRPCILMGITLKAGTGAASCIVYDNSAAASGTEVAHDSIDGTTSLASSQHDLDVECNNGIYLDLTGTGASAIVYYSLL